MTCRNVEKLIKKRQSPIDQPVYYVTIVDNFDVFKKAHIATGHGGRDRMLKHFNVKYTNITKDSVELFKAYCQVHQENKTG
ncbi:hypothetical protein DPMN_139581 [Dreissena polymorpha]|uniref:Integrase zinc-binding domain-containing protein n=1 Tax=Dreissena polymorpha TaxID=45954 RepID=A0A9D4JGM8_DREPO|nr:hypothetical protein DPMN_139581 [Dreissena polymorpha]